MCLMAYKPIGAPLPEQYLRNAWAHNPHGAGFMFCKDGELVIEKPFFKLKEFLKAYMAALAAYGEKSAFAVHFRYATHGSPNELNTHPHPLADGRVGLAHNGILDDFDPPAYDISDTVWFCNTVLAGRHEDQLLDPDFCTWMEDLIGISNKFILLCGDGRYAIIGEKNGKWDDGVWYSNGGYNTPVCKISACCNLNAHASLFPPEMNEEWDAPIDNHDWDSLDELQWRELQALEEMDARYDALLQADECGKVK